MSGLAGAAGVLSMELGVLFLALLLVSAAAGFVAGLFGIGGGVIIVPALYAVFGAVDAEDSVRMHAAVATSLATIAVTAARSTWAHHRYGAVDFTILRQWIPWIIVGALLGAATATRAPGAVLTGLFALGAGLLALRFALAGDTPKPAARPLVGPGLAAAAGGVGFVSSWFGIGGGILGVMALSMGGVAMHRAVATAAAFGVAIGAPAALGFIISGWGVEGLPPGSLGYVNAPAFLTIIAVTALTAPLGARVAHGLSQRRLRRVFAGVLASMAVLMALDVVGL